MFREERRLFFNIFIVNVFVDDETQHITTYIIGIMNNS